MCRTIHHSNRDVPGRTQSDAKVCLPSLSFVARSDEKSLADAARKAAAQKTGDVRRVRLPLRPAGEHGKAPMADFLVEGDDVYVMTEDVSFHIIHFAANCNQGRWYLPAEITPVCLKNCPELPLADSAAPTPAFTRTWLPGLVIRSVRRFLPQTSTAVSEEPPAQDSADQDLAAVAPTKALPEARTAVQKRKGKGRR